MKIINLSGPNYDVNLVVENIAYLIKTTNSHTGYTLVAIDGKSFPLSEAQYNEIKTYLENN